MECHNEKEQDLGEGGEGMFDGKGLNVMDLEFGNVPGVRKDIDLTTCGRFKECP